MVATSRFVTCALGLLACLHWSGSASAAVYGGETSERALAATAASPVSLGVDRPCYVPGEVVNARGSGYTPGGGVMMAFSVISPSGTFDNFFRNGLLTADSSGNISDRFAAPDLLSSKDAEDTVAVNATDQQSEANGRTYFRLSSFTVRVRPWEQRHADPRKTATFKAYGFEGLGPVLYAHYFLHGKLMKTVRVGALTGDCGDLAKTMPQFPFRPVPAGDYRVNFDTSRRYSSKADGIRYAHVTVPASKALR